MENVNGTRFEAAKLYLNKETVEIDLTYDDLIALYDVINKSDLFIYTYLMLNSVKGKTFSLNVQSSNGVKNTMWK